LFYPHSINAKIKVARGDKKARIHSDSKPSACAIVFMFRFVLKNELVGGSAVISPVDRGPNN